MSAVHLLTPTLTLGPSEDAQRFFAACKEQLLSFVSVSEIVNETALRATHPGNNDAVVIFNRGDNQYPPLVLEFLKDSLRDKAIVVSVATTPACRRPPEPIQNEQSFDITDHLRRRSLSSSQMETIAAVFGRQLLAKLEPTLTNEPMHLFLSYRRIDGEEIAGSFHDDLNVRTQTVFRDLISVRIGEDAQQVIEENLHQSDAVIFLDTPKSGTSPWIAKELQIALSLNLPIVWVRIGAEEGRPELCVMPAAHPHYGFAEMQPRRDRIPAAAIEQIVHKAFEISREIFANRVFDQIRHLRRLADANRATFVEMDKSRLLYSITLPQREFRYPLRPITQVLQFFWSLADGE